MHVFEPSRPSKALAPASYLLIYIAEKLIALRPEQPSLDMSAIKTRDNTPNGWQTPSLLLVAGMFWQPWRCSREKGMRWLTIWPCAVICLGQAPAAALSSYLRVLCNCSRALDPKPGRNICMFTFIILFRLYGGLPGSVCKQRTQGKKCYFSD